MAAPHADTLAGFLGVNLRRDRLSLADGDMARAINADLHTLPGTIRSRMGIGLFRTGLPAAVSRLARVNSSDFALIGTAWYREGVVIISGPLTPFNGAMVGMRPLDDTVSWTFLANSAAMWKVSSISSIVQWGSPAPTTACTVADGGAGTLIGNYSVRYTYLRKVGTSVAYESNPSPVSNTVALTNRVILVTGLTDSSDSQITHKRLYRTVNSGSDWLFEKDVAQGTTTAQLDVDDDALGTAIEEDNDLPPNCGWAAEFQNHMFLAMDTSNPHYLWYSKRFKPESVPAANYLEIGYPGDPITGGARLVGLLGVFTRDTKYRVIGNATSGFVAIEALSSRGTPAGQAVTVTDQGALFVARDGIYLTNFQSADSALGTAIEAIFYNETVNDYRPIDWNQAQYISLGSYRQRYYFSYPQVGGGTITAVYSRETQKWYFYELDPCAFFTDEQTDRLWGGTPGGDILTIDSGDPSTETFTVTAELADRGGPQTVIRKRYLYCSIDADPNGGQIIFLVYIDGTLRHTIRMTGRRRKQLHRLPDKMLGYTVRVVVQMSHTATQEVHSVSVINVPLEVY